MEIGGTRKGAGRPDALWGKTTRIRVPVGCLDLVNRIIQRYKTKQSKGSSTMKKLLITTAILFAFTSSAFAAQDTVKDYDQVPAFLQRIDLLKNQDIKLPHQDDLKSMRSIAKFVHENFKYVAEGDNHWQSVQETLKLGTGDCEDMAIVTFQYLLKRGYHVQLAVGVLGAGDRDAGQEHAVVFINDQYVIDSRSSEVFMLESYREKFDVQYTIDNLAVYKP